MDPAVLRDDMVASLEHDSKRVLHSEALSVAFRSVPRETFVPDGYSAYADRPFERHGTRVLAPSTAARLLEALGPQEGDSVLIVGAGVGYTAAICAEIVGGHDVHAIDIARRLVWEARENLDRVGHGAALIDRRDGKRGLPEYAPFDRILLEAAAVRPPPALLGQLAPGGRLLMPVGLGEQTLTTITEAGDRRPHGTVAFAPMLVESERTDTVERNRTAREDREFAERAAERRRGWEQDWIDWDQYR